MLGVKESLYSQLHMRSIIKPKPNAAVVTAVRLISTLVLNIMMIVPKKSVKAVEIQIKRIG